MTIWKIETPRGDGNDSDMKQADIVEKIWKIETPRGDGNLYLSKVIHCFLCIWKIETPRGDGNSVKLFYRNLKHLFGK